MTRVQSYEVRVLVAIRNEDTQEVRHTESHLRFDSDDVEPDVSPWTVGNDSCDCNRMLLFFQDEDGEVSEVACGEGKFKVRIINPVNNQLLYSEY